MAVDPADLGARVRAKRQGLNWSLRQAAEELGVSAATLTRVESGNHLPDRKNLFELARWVGMDLGSGPGEPQQLHSPDATTVEAITLHLRADPDLQAEDAEMLVDIMQTAYERLRSRGA